MEYYQNENQKTGKVKIDLARLGNLRLEAEEIQFLRELADKPCVGNIEIVPPCAEIINLIPPCEGINKDGD